MTTEAEKKRSFVDRLFTDIAPRYDFFNRIVSCGLDQSWRRKTLSRGDITSDKRVLDVCAGTGDLSIMCAGTNGHSGVVVGVDMNRAMLSHAARKSRRRSFPISWLQADALALPFCDSCFDRVMIGFSTRNLSDFNRGIHEMIRVLKPGGRLAILETGYPRNPILRLGYRTFLFTFARLIGFVLTGRVWPFTYLAESVRRFLSPKEVVARLASVGTDVEYIPLSLGLASLYIAIKK